MGTPKALLGGHQRRLFQTAVAAGLGPTREGRFLLSGDHLCPADVLVPNWAGGRDAALDLTVVTTIQTQTMPQAAFTPGRALTHAYERKM